MKKEIDYTTRPVYFYRFVCNDPNIINLYVGSTVDMTDRKTSHKKVCNNPKYKGYNTLIYTTIRDNGGWLNWRMLEIEHKIVKDKTEAKQREQYWIEFYNAQMNMNQVITVNKHKDYYERHRDKCLAIQRIYDKQRRNTKVDYNRQYRKKNQEQLQNYTIEYYQQNKEKRKEYQREYSLRKKEQTKMSMEDVNVNTL